MFNHAAMRECGKNVQVNVVRKTQGRTEGYFRERKNCGRIKVSNRRNKETMKTLLISVFLAIGVLTSPVALTGCKTASAEQIAYKSLKSVQQASVAALEIYGAAYRRGEISISERAKVEGLYRKYQAAFSVVATAARFDYNSPSTPELTAALTELIQLIQTFKKP